MERRSAGLLPWRRRHAVLEALLGHHGGPYFATKDLGTWTVIKGEFEPGETAIDVARREFEEETGFAPPSGDPVPLGEIRQRGGKLVEAWALEGDLDPALAVSNTFDMEWPPRSGRIRSFPEIDRVEWFDLAIARVKIKDAQIPFLDRLVEALA
jgi:predicted NUDIX family NTP pyrophosphohydrolase